MQQTACNLDVFGCTTIDKPSAMQPKKVTLTLNFESCSNPKFVHMVLRTSASPCGANLTLLAQLPVKQL